MRISQIAVMVAFAGIVLLPPITQAKVVRIEDFNSNFSRGPRTDHTSGGGGGCEAYGVYKGLDLVTITASTTLPNAYKNTCYYYTKYGEVTYRGEELKKCWTRHAQAANTAPSSNGTSSGSALDVSSYYTSRDCPNPITAVTYCDSHHNKVSNQYYQNCSCPDRTYTVRKIVASSAGSNFIWGALFESYTDKSTNEVIQCHLAAPTCVSSLTSVTADGNTIKSMINASGYTYSSGADGIGSGTNFAKINIVADYTAISGSGINGNFTGYQVPYIDGRLSRYVLCMENVSDDALFTQTAKVGPNVTAPRANVVNGGIRLPWVVGGSYKYATSCTSSYSGFVTSATNICPGGTSIDLGDSFYQYKNNTFTKGYCYKCGGCANGFSDNKLYIASGISNYSGGGNTAYFATNGCQVICASGYTQVCLGSGSTACNNAGLDASGVPAASITSISGTTGTGLNVMYTYDVHRLTVASSSTIYGRIACATPVGCNVASGYLTSTCDTGNSWASWFNF